MNGDFVHRLGAAVAMVLVAGRLTRGLGAVRRGRALRKRLRGLLAPQPAPVRSAGRRAEALSALRPWLPLVGTVGAGWALVGGAVGVLVGLVGAAALWRWSARRSAAGTEAAEVAAAQAARQLPLAADLLAACIAAGASPVAAARAVGEALGGPVGDALGRGAAEVRLGGEPSGAWQGLAAVPGAVPLARLLERAEVSGLPAAGPVARLAAQARADWARTTTVRARRAAVMVTAPVGLCFLPAFIAVGVLPVVIGLAGGVLGGGGGGG
ncbi:type II secretion system F family protein [Streptomyces rubrogriseus]